MEGGFNSFLFLFQIVNVNVIWINLDLHARTEASTRRGVSVFNRYLAATIRERKCLKFLEI